LTQKLFSLTECISTTGTTSNFSLCVSEATLTISYRPSDPQVENVIPNMAPIVNSIDDNTTTTIHIYGSDFIPTDHPYCLFGGVVRFYFTKIRIINQ
jgi:hypothetical protein